MRKLAYLMLSLLCAGFIASCSDDDEVVPPTPPTPPTPGATDGVITVNGETDLVFNAEAGSKTVAFNSNMAWSAVIEKAEWLSVEPASGEAGDIKMTVKAAANEAGEAREGKIVLKTDDNKGM